VLCNDFLSISYQMEDPRAGDAEAGNDGGPSASANKPITGGRKSKTVFTGRHFSGESIVAIIDHAAPTSHFEKVCTPSFTHSTTTRTHSTTTPLTSFLTVIIIAVTLGGGGVIECSAYEGL